MLKSFFILILNIVILGLVCPELMSIDDSMLCLLGFVVAIATIFLDLTFIIKGVKNYEENN